ncbi:MAG: HIT family protein [Gammaproteobacteria bacterium]|nr:HIT family protein [Gammaproteobacteria bacterium]
MPNPTAARFGYPRTLVREYEHWLVLLREDQVTLGSLVLCARSDVTAFAELPAEAFTEMAIVVGEIEHSLRAAIGYGKINYLMLMMSDPNVHFHVLPRYPGERSACGLTIADRGWPAAPNLAEPRALDEFESTRLIDYLGGHWVGSMPPAGRHS